MHVICSVARRNDNGKSTMKKFLKDPLVHFLVAGAALFGAINILAPAEEADRIMVDRAALLSFIQYRSKAFEPETAAAILDAMSEESRQRLIDDYVREEALYREAKKMGLDQGDYVIRQRMVQKFEFMTKSASTPGEPDAEALAGYYEKNKQDYYVQPGATLAHVFVSATKHPSDYQAKAETLLGELRQSDAQFEDATGYGDRFLFHTNYIERTFAYIKSHFGETATEVIFDDAMPLSQWAGPVMSKHGAHLIFVTARNPGFIQPLEEIKSTVAADMIGAAQRARNEKLIDAIIKDYAPVIDLDDIAVTPASATP